MNSVWYLSFLYLTSEIKHFEKKIEINPHYIFLSGYSLNCCCHFLDSNHIITSHCSHGSIFSYLVTVIINYLLLGPAYPELAVLISWPQNDKNILLKIISDYYGDIMYITYSATLIWNK